MSCPFPHVGRHITAYKNVLRASLNKTFLSFLLQVIVINQHAPLLSLNKTREMFLFNDALNTFYLRLYGVRHMVKDHFDSEKGNPLSPHRLLLSIKSKGSFICTIPQDNTYHGLCYTSRGALAGARNSSMGLPHEGSIRRPTA